MLRYFFFFFLRLILFKYHLFTFKYTHPILFKTQEYLCLAIFEKPMIQIHGKTILPMEFKSIIKAHDSNLWQFIHLKPNSHWQYQKPNSHWQHQNPIFIGITLSKTKKKYHVKMLPWQKRTMAIILWRNSLRAILRIMFSYYEPMKYMDIILHHDIHNIYLLHSW